MPPLGRKPCHAPPNQCPGRSSCAQNLSMSMRQDGCRSLNEFLPLFSRLFGGFSSGLLRQSVVAWLVTNPLSLQDRCNRHVPACQPWCCGATHTHTHTHNTPAANGRKRRRIAVVCESFWCQLLGAPVPHKTTKTSWSTKYGRHIQPFNTIYTIQDHNTRNGQERPIQSNPTGGEGDW